MIEPMPEPAPDVPLQYLNDPNSPPPVSLPPIDSTDMSELEYLREVRPDLVRPNYLRSPSRLTQPGIPLEEPLESFELLDLPMDAPLGFTGPSSVYPRDRRPAATSCRWKIAGGWAFPNGTATAKVIPAWTTILMLEATGATRTTRTC